MITDLVSIITPNCNTEKYIGDTIMSVLNQTYENWEMIIVDDCSKDNSITIINKFLKIDNRIKLVRLKENKGAAVSRNKAISLAKGKFIAFLDSDDLWMPTKLEEQLNFMIHNNYEFTYTSYKRINEKGEDIKSDIICEKELTYKKMLTSNKIGCLTVIYNANSLGKCFMPEIRKRQDYALWLKILKKVPKAYGLNVKLSTYRIREGSISNNKLEMLRWNWILYKKIEKLNYLESIFYLLNNIYNKFLTK